MVHPFPIITNMSIKIIMRRLFHLSAHENTDHTGIHKLFSLKAKSFCLFLPYIYINEDACLESCQHLIWSFFKPLSIFAKVAMLDVWQGSEYACETDNKWQQTSRLNQVNWVAFVWSI